MLWLLDVLPNELLYLSPQRMLISAKVGCFNGIAPDDSAPVFCVLPTTELPNGLQVLHPCVSQRMKSEKASNLAALFVPLFW